MARFDHPNVMKLLGVTISGNKTFIIMPYMAQGSLLSFLRKHRAELTIDNADMSDMVCIVMEFTPSITSLTMSECLI